MTTQLFTILDDEGFEIEVKLPVNYVVCSGCGGTGEITNPSIGAITSEEWDRDWAIEEQDDYMNGVYNVPCTTCQGKRVVAEIDRKKADPKLVKMIDDQEREIAELEAMERAERRMGA